MTATTPSFKLGRHVYRAPALASGLVMLVRHDYREYDQLNALSNAAVGPAAFTPQRSRRSSAALRFRYGDRKKPAQSSSLWWLGFR